jgi:hypothetical protein
MNHATQLRRCYSAPSNKQTLQSPLLVDWLSGTAFAKTDGKGLDLWFLTSGREKAAPVKTMVLV